MKKVIVFSSVTYALRAQEILKYNGIYANLTRSRAVKNVRGCGYGISFDPAYLSRAEGLLVQAGVPMLGSVDEK